MGAVPGKAPADSRLLRGGRHLVLLRAAVRLAMATPFYAGAAAEEFAPFLVTVAAASSQQVIYGAGPGKGTPTLIYNRDPLVTVYLGSEGSSAGDSTLHILDPLTPVVLSGDN